AWMRKHVNCTHCSAVSEGESAGLLRTKATRLTSHLRLLPIHNIWSIDSTRSARRALQKEEASLFLQRVTRRPGCAAFQPARLLPGTCSWLRPTRGLNECDLFCLRRRQPRGCPALQKLWGRAGYGAVAPAHGRASGG